MEIGLAVLAVHRCLALRFLTFVVDQTTSIHTNYLLHTAWRLETRTLDLDLQMIRRRSVRLSIKPLFFLTHSRQKLCTSRLLGNTILSSFSRNDPLLFSTYCDHHWLLFIDPSLWPTYSLVNNVPTDGLIILDVSPFSPPPPPHRLRPFNERARDTRNSISFNVPTFSFFLF